MSKHESTAIEQFTLLVVEDDSALRQALVDMLLRAGFNCHSARNGEEALEAMERVRFDLILSDLQMPKMDGLAFVPLAIKKVPYIPIVLMTAYGSVEKAVAAIKLGAIDFINKPFEYKSLIEKIRRYLPMSPQYLSSFSAPEICEQWSFVTESPVMHQALLLADKVAQSNANVLITGPSGTGKEVISRFVHAQSQRASQAFVAVNCAAIPENMLEAMLFGYEKGAFTGAQNAMPGKFEQANGGTLLLDEITEMPMSLQAKLLRVLQEREVERLGGKKTLQLDVRVLATSNRNLVAAVASGQFREDLFYRLNVFPIMLPGLKDRVCDIIPLSEFLLAKHAQDRRLRFSQEACSALLSHPWVGNVRELENVVQRAIILTDGDVIGPEALLLELGGTGEGINLFQAKSAYQSTLYSASERSGTHEAKVLPAAADQPLPQAQIPDSQAVQEADACYSNEPKLGDNLRSEENRLIIDALKQTGGSRKAAAEQLGISTRTLRYKLARIKALGVNLEAVLEA